MPAKPSAHPIGSLVLDPAAPRRRHYDVLAHCLPPNRGRRTPRRRFQRRHRPRHEAPRRSIRGAHVDPHPRVPRGQPRRAHQPQGLGPAAVQRRRQEPHRPRWRRHRPHDHVPRRCVACAFDNVRPPDRSEQRASTTASSTPPTSPRPCCTSSRAARQWPRRYVAQHPPVLPP
jgi:hypothetical protein